MFCAVDGRFHFEGQIENQSAFVPKYAVVLCPDYAIHCTEIAVIPDVTVRETGRPEIERFFA